MSRGSGEVGGNKECAGRERKAERRERKGWEAGLDMGR